MAGNPEKHSEQWSRSDISLLVLSAACFIYAMFIAIRYADQLPLDFYSFRQTQTALTAYWLGINGFSLAYETPVVGPPWSIPFEFPLYQYIVAMLSKALSMDLNVSGRLVSFIFLALCIFPAWKIARLQQVSRASLLIFIALLFSSPLYVYWGRTFMIETAALFFTLMAIRYFIDLAGDEATSRSGFLYLVFILLAILQKTTTPLPTLAVLAVVYLVKSVKDSGSFKAVVSVRFIRFSFLYFFIPLLIGTLWTLYADHVKTANEFGSQLISSALREWTWGTWADRVSPRLYIDVIWRRLFYQNLAGPLGLALIIAGLVLKASGKINSTIAICVAMGILPLFIFPNLHTVHAYYQTANLIFLLFAVALVVGDSYGRGTKAKITAIVIATVMVASNHFVFASDFLKTVQTVYTPVNSRDVAVATVLRNNLQKDEVFVTFGDMWSSSFSYLSGHKSFTVPSQYKHYQHAILKPEEHIGAYRLGAVVVCREPHEFLLPEIAKWAKNGRNWKISEAHGCYVALPEKHPIAHIARSCIRRMPGVNRLRRAD